MAVYATSALVLAQYPNAFGSVAPSLIDTFCVNRSAYADAKMRARYALPLGLPYDPALVQAVIDLVAWDAIQARGYNPQSGSDRNFQTRAVGRDGDGKTGAEKLLNDVERQCAHFNVVEAIQPSPAYPAPLLVSSPLQGWGPNDFPCRTVIG